MATGMRKILTVVAAPARKAAAMMKKAATPLRKAVSPLRKVAAPFARALAPLAKHLAPLSKGPAFLRKGVVALREKARAAKLTIATCGLALFLGLFISLMGINSYAVMVALVVGLAAMVVACFILYAGVHGREWAISLSFILITFTIDATFRRRGDMADSGMDAQTLLKLVLWGGGFLIGALNFSHIKNALAESVPLRWLLAFATWSFFSTVYSITPTYTFGGGFGYLALLCFVAVVVQKLGMAKLRMGAIYACGLLTTSALALYAVMPSIAVAQLENGSTPRLCGLTGSPNNLGRTAAIALFFIFFAVRDKQVKFWRPDIAIIALSAVVSLLMSWSRTSLAGVIAAIAIVFLRRRILLMLWGAIGVLTTFFAMILANVDWDRLISVFSRHGSLSELTTLTGRTAIWHFVWNAIEKKPLLGYGYGSTKLLISSGFWTVFGWTTTSAHNMFLQALVTTGAVGALCIVMVILLQLRDFVKRPNDMADAAFIFVLITGFSEAGAVGVAPNLLTIFWLMSLVVPRGERVAEQVPEQVQPLRGESWALPARPTGSWT
ncbi:O-antigen ligase family protein [Geomonas sp. RF6]|uniref:O-antigen ligase family protein n=1 Tax=Geomonas sp. RF6 TaxID=2897342 RepID=UPI001E29542C|nr:O-antigen ligase [Geomonas sp. RF6]UFS68822.1 O-antigen ligase family protein [Geomonas sp. RF6]